LKKTVPVTFKVTPESNQRISELAEHHGRTRPELIRLALAMFDRSSYLAYLDTPEAAAELGDEIHRERAEVVQTLHDCERKAFGPRRPLTAPVLQ
jgi:predicted transcriptional regulator